MVESWTDITYIAIRSSSSLTVSNLLLLKRAAVPNLQWRKFKGTQMRVVVISCLPWRKTGKKYL